MVELRVFLDFTGAAARLGFEVVTCLFFHLAVVIVVTITELPAAYVMMLMAGWMDGIAGTGT